MLGRTTMKYHFTSPRNAFEEHPQKIIYVGENVEELKHLCIAGRNVKCYSCYGGSSKKILNIELSYAPVIPLPGIHTPKIESRYSGICIPMFLAALLTIAKDGNNPNVHLWKNKHNVDYHTMDYNSALKKNEILTHATTWVEPENMLSEISQTQKVECCIIPLLWST